ncbi:hypothetical protein BG842_19475 [Haladaptatus sp. W1]|nr:hypothetical protein BG842_19475 [Haladaptatus sp. W1]
MARQSVALTVDERSESVGEDVAVAALCGRNTDGNERGRPLAFTVVVSPTPLAEARGLCRVEMSASDRERGGGFRGLLRGDVVSFKHNMT